MKKRGLSLLLAIIMVATVFSPAWGIVASAADTDYVELAFDNLFIFEQWANSTMSGRLPGGYNDAGTLTKNMTSGSLTLTRKDDGVHPDCYTGFDFDTCSGYYVIPVEGNTVYNFSYDIQSTGGYGTYVFCYDKDKVSLGTEYNVHFFSSTSKNWNFTTPADAAYIQVRFDSNNVGVASTFSNIRICKADTHKGTSTVRKAYTKGSGNYGALPVPTREGYTFGGWFTGENGTGEQITENTPIRSESISVFARWDIAVNSVSIKEMPTKVEYSVGEHINTTGLVLNAVSGSTTHEISSGFSCTPEYLNTVGTQTITVTYAGKTATFDVVVKDSIQQSILLNGIGVSAKVTNGKYSFTYLADFNYYKITYKTSSYMKGIITFGDGTTEAFYLEPSKNGSFSSYIDDYFVSENNKLTRTGIKSIEFTYLDKNLGDFELLSVSTESRRRVYTEQRFSNDQFTIGINYQWGGTLSYLEDIENRPKATADTAGTTISLGSGEGLNLINTYDKGRYIQAAYYGTDGSNDDYKQGTYTGQLWPYNPVQGGNQKNDDQTGYNAASKVVDYEAIYEGDQISEIYVKTQPLDWAKSKEYITPSYMETRYVFEHGMIKVYCRFIDFSGYKHNAEKRQEIPAVYPIEPFNEFIYHTGGKAWSSSNGMVKKGQNDLDFDNVNKGPTDVLNVNENWAAFIDSSSNYGIGVYSSRADGFSVGVFRPAGNTKSTDDNPTDDDPSSYLTPFATYKMESFKVEESAYYITTGSPTEIRNDFEKVANPNYAEKVSQGVISVPELIYLSPSTGATSTAQYYVNNEVDSEGNITLQRVNNDTTGYMAIYAPGMAGFEFTANIVGQADNSAEFELEDTSYTTNYMAATGCGNTTGYIFKDGVNLNSLASGLTAGSTALVEWKFTLYYGDAKTADNGSIANEDELEAKTYYAYTTLYAPWYTPVGAANRIETYWGNVFGQSVAWMSGVHGYDATSTSSSGYTLLNGQTFSNEKYDNIYYAKISGYSLVPLISTITDGNGKNAVTTWLTTSDSGVANNAPYATIRYANQTGEKNGIILSQVSPIATMTVDTSRYTNFNQIPNFTVGYNVTDVDRAEETYWYISDCTTSARSSDAVSERFYNHYIGAGYDDIVDDNVWFETIGDSYISGHKDTNKGGTGNYGGCEYSGVWNRTIDNDSTVTETKGYAIKGAVLAKSTTWSSKGRAYSINYVQLRATQVDKASLRELVLKASSLEESNYTAESWSAFKKALQAAAAELGNPTDSDVSAVTTELRNKMNALQTTVTLNANGGETTKTVNVTVGAASAATFTPDTPVKGGYELVSWNSRETGNGTDYGKDEITVPFNATIYAQWSPVEYKLTYNPDGGNMGSTSKIYTIDSVFAIETATRNDYRLTGWKVTTADGNWDASKTYAAGEAINGLYGNVTLTAQWELDIYTINFDGNSADDIAYTQAQLVASGSVTLPNAGKDGNVLLGWAYSNNATSPVFAPNATITLNDIDSSKFVDYSLTLHAVWYAPGKINVTFDNLVDISKWSTYVNPEKGTLTDVTDTGFTVKSYEGVDEATCSSDYFNVTAGQKYVVDVDVKGDNWDIYFFFCDANGAWVAFTDSGNRLSSSGNHNVSKVDGIHYTSTVFTAPAGAVKAQLRVDANGSNNNNAVRFENIRVYDTANTTYLNTVNKYVEYGDAYGELPVPVKEGQQFLGWVDDKGNTVTADSIMNSLDTVYLTSTWTTNANTANDDTVVIEYGSPVEINLIANDKSGTVSGIGTTGVGASSLNTKGFTSSILTDRTNKLTLTAGTVTLNGDGTVTFTPSDTNVSKEIVFYYEFTVSGAYYYAKVTIIPATTLYFEDTFFTFENSTVKKNGTTYNYKWQKLGESVGETFQSADRPGEFNFYDDANNVYGYDSMSDGEVSYSGGSAHFTEVDQIAGANTPKATFTFTGTGFDLFSVTDSKSGTVTVTIYRGTDTSNRLMGIISNTYFGYTYDADSDSYVTTDNGALFQVPVLRTRDLGYGTYTVVVQPRYNRAFDAAGTGLSGFYVDSVRIYNPMGSDNEVANDAYKADGEYAPQYLEIRDTLVALNKEGKLELTDQGKNKSVFLDGGKTTMDDFANLGPKNEVYLQNGNSIAFHIVTDRAALPSTVQLGMKLSGKGGNTATVNLMNASYNTWSENITLNSTMERYYNIEAVVDWVKQDDGTYKTAEPIVVTNTSDAIISVTSLKWAFDDDYNSATVLSLMTDMDTPELAKAAIMRMNNPQDDPQQTILNKDNISYAFSSESYAPGDVGTLTITTEQGVAGVRVNGEDVLDCVTNEDGKLEWTFEFTAEDAASMIFEIVANNDEGITSETIYATIAIENDVADDGENDATEPDDGVADDTTEPDDEVTDDPTIDSGIGSITGIDSFATNLVTKILALIMKVFGLLLGGVIA